MGCGVVLLESVDMRMGLGRVGGDGGGVRGRAAAGPRHAHLGRRQLDDHQLRVHAGAGGLRVRGARAERQRRQAGEVSGSIFFK